MNIISWYSLRVTDGADSQNTEKRTKKLDRRERERVRKRESKRERVK